MALSHQFGKAAIKSASEMAAEISNTAPDKKSVERKVVIAPEMTTSHTGTFALEPPTPVAVERTGEKKAWGPRIDTAILDLVKRNSKNQTADAEEMILIYATMNGWT